MHFKLLGARYLFEFQVSGEHAIVAKNISLFVNGHSPRLSTPLQPRRYHLKVAAHSNGKNLTQRSERIQREICIKKSQSYSKICNLIYNIKYCQKKVTDRRISVIAEKPHLRFSSAVAKLK